MNTLESQKQLLIAESELNRTLMVTEMGALKVDLTRLSDRVKTFSSISSAAAVLFAGVTAFHRAKPAEATDKPSWVQTLLKGAGLVSSLWLAFRPKSGDDHNDKQ